VKQKSASNLQLATWLSGIALGAVAMYLSDPSEGRRRRAMAQDKVRSMTSKTGDAINAAVRDAGNRLTGLQVRASRVMHNGAKPIDDHVLTARVHAKIGRSVSNAHAIDVMAQGGCVTLSGPVLADEKAYLLSRVQAIPGVTDVRDRLNAYDEETGGSNAALMQDWTPMRIMALLGGGVLGYYGLTRRSPAGVTLAAVGLGLLVRNAGGFDLKRLFGMAAGTQEVVVEKTIQINATPDAVFDVWSRYENFPRFMSHVAEVSDLGQQRSRWIVKGPAGAEVEWNAVLTECTRPTRMAWQSEPGATVDNAGSVRLEPANGGTRVMVRMSYIPPAGVLGQTVAILLGSDPEQQLEDDLMRMKDFIERGAPLQDAVPPVSASNQLLH
jgi:uncharacterized membrane protein